MKPLLRLTGAFVACRPALGLAAPPASAQDKKVRAQMGWAFPSTTGLLGPTQTRLVEMMRTISGGSIDVKGFEPGALVPASQYLDAVGNGSLDMAWTVSGFWTGKDIAFAMYGSVPFGPDVGEYLAWMKFGGGEKMMKELHAKYNVEVMTCGVISPEASGWFRKEIKSLDDLKGLKMRFFGLGANVMQKMGVSTQLLQAGEIFQALQLGTIDATEFSMPVMDLTLGLPPGRQVLLLPGLAPAGDDQRADHLEGEVGRVQRHAEGADPGRLRRHHAAAVRRGRGGAVQGDARDPGQGRDDQEMAAGVPGRL